MAVDAGELLFLAFVSSLDLQIYKTHLDANGVLTAEGMSKISEIVRKAEEDGVSLIADTSAEEMRILRNRLQNEKTLTAQTFSDILKEAKTHKGNMIAEADAWKTEEIGLLQRTNKQMTAEE